MNVMKLKAGELVAKRQEKVMEWYLIQEGSVVQKFGFSEITLGIKPTLCEVSKFTQSEKRKCAV